MSKPPKSGDGATHIVQGGSAGKAADMDNMMTTIRSRVAGRLVVTDGPGKGQSVQIFEGSNSIGRDPAKNVAVIDFGDAAIHRDPHAYLTVTGGKANLTDNGQQNPLKLNGQPVAGLMVVTSGDQILIGMTTLRVELT